MMKRKALRVPALLAGLTLLAPPVFAQGPKAHPIGVLKADESRRTLYTPRVEGRSSSFITEGRVVQIAPGKIVIKTALGERRDLRINRDTTLFEAGELVSIATMPAITLRLSALRVSDQVEIVVEQAGGNEVATIITRLARKERQTGRR